MHGFGQPASISEERRLIDGVLTTLGSLFPRELLSSLFGMRWGGNPETALDHPDRHRRAAERRNISVNKRPTTLPPSNKRKISGLGTPIDAGPLADPHPMKINALRSVGRQSAYLV
jgi:hypothetical protein